MLLAGEGVRILTDPWLGERIGPWHRWRSCAFTPEVLRGLDAVLLSHAHPDHLDSGTLRRLPPETPVLTAAGTPLRRLRRLPLSRVVALRPWDAWEGAGFRVIAVPKVHTRWSLGFVVELAGARIYFAGDAGPGTPFEEIRRRCGRPDVALLPVGGSILAPGPLQRHLTPRLAAEAAVRLEPRVVLPIHWGHVPCVPAFLDRFRGRPEQFLEELARLAPGIPALLPPEGVAVRLLPVPRADNPSVNP